MSNKLYCRVFILTIGLAVAGLSFGQIPDHPSKLSYQPLKFDPPKPADYRVALGNGMVVYIKEDHTLPIFDMTAIIRTGSIYDPKDKIGLAAMTGTVLRTGGTKNISGDDLDEKLDFLGASISSSIGRTSGRVSLSCLARDIDEGLRLFADVLMHPAFEEQKIKLYKDQAIDAIKNKNDNPRTVLEREFNKLLYGDHPLVWEETKASIERISQSDLFDFHSKYFAPNNIILAVAGDFNRSEMLRKIEDAFLNWPKKEIRFPKVPPVIEKNRPGVFMIQKDINQGYVNVGHFGIKDTNPDLFAVNLMNFILGGGSFTSRITSKVRSDEGLAYNTGSRFATEHDFPGTFYGYVQTKSATVHYAISLILNEFKRIQKELVSDQELETAKNYYLDSFPDRFSSAIGTMISFANLEYDGFPMDYYDTYREKYQAVTKQDILRVAKKYIKPGEMSIFVVGDIEKCKAGDEKHPGTLDQLGKIVEIKLGDPLAGE
ncbi:MAG: insulinase family protein [candidate division KSB1 bacterium]|nr:insulinase family protein [candidate division KSB1 bacterium]